jgi:hypothetical protein
MEVRLLLHASAVATATPAQCPTVAALALYSVSDASASGPTPRCNRCISSGAWLTHAVDSSPTL